MHTAGDEIIPCALGGGADEDGGLYLDKAVLVKVISGYLGYLVAHEDILLQVGATQVKITVLESRKLRGLAVLDYLKGRSFALCKHSEVGHLYLDIAGRDIGVL